MCFRSISSGVSLVDSSHTLEVVSFEQYKKDQAEKETEIRNLLVNVTLSDRDKADLQKALDDVERRSKDERASYDTHISELLLAHGEAHSAPDFGNILGEDCVSGSSVKVATTQTQAKAPVHRERHERQGKED